MATHTDTRILRLSITADSTSISMATAWLSGPFFPRNQVFIVASCCASLLLIWISLLTAWISMMLA